MQHSVDVSEEQECSPGDLYRGPGPVLNDQKIGGLNVDQRHPVEAAAFDIES